MNGEAAEREAGGLEKLQVVWDNIDGNRVVGDLPNLGLYLIWLTDRAKLSYIGDLGWKQSSNKPQELE